jgi:hypothetical protein
LFVAAVAIGLLAIAVSTLPSRSPAALAAPSSKNSDPFDELFRAVYSPPYQGDEISCTLTYTTTDSLDNKNACPVGESVSYCAEEKAVTLSNYSNLALVDETDVPEGEEREIAVHDDWFRLDRAQVDALYTVEAAPARTINYNMGIIVYGPSYAEVTSDIDSIDNNSSEVTFEAEGQGPYFIRVFQITDDCTGRLYDLNVSKLGPTATPTSTPIPTTDEDDYEPNDSFEEANQEVPTLPIQVPILLELTFHTSDDQDYFRFYTKEDRSYQATTSDLSLVDTLVEIYDEDRTRIERDDDGGGGLASQATWKADYDGYYYIVVQNNVASAGSYNLTLAEITEPTKTPSPSRTPGVGPTPRGRADDCEDNLDFQRACVIAVDKAQTFNFVPVFGKGPDNDFYRIWVKSGLHFRCETSDLAPGLDPNMIMFNGPSWDNVVAGNDDFETGDYNSAINYYATYDGWLYLLVGTGDRTPPDVYDSDYTLLCEKGTEPFSATRTPRPTATPEATSGPTATPTPTTAGSPVATPTPETEELTVRPLTTPTPAARVTPSPRFVPIRLLVYYDGNGDRQPGAGEGIAGISAQAYEVVSNELLAQDFTDEQGSLEFTVAAQGPVRISIPFLGFSHLVTGAEASIQVRVPPHSLPRGTP